MATGSVKIEIKSATETYCISVTKQATQDILLTLLFGLRAGNCTPQLSVLKAQQVSKQFQLLKHLPHTVPKNNKSHMDQGQRRSLRAGVPPSYSATDSDRSIPMDSF